MLIGHQRIWDYLQRSAKQKRLSHAYLFVGPAQVGKATLAREFAKWLLCERPSVKNFACGQCRACLAIERGQHPDVAIIAQRTNDKKEEIKNKEISIDQIRELQHQLSLSAYSAPYKIAIIEETADLSGEAANAFLKTLEEPSTRSLIILISANWRSILPTIISRCQLIKFLPVPEKELVAKLKGLAKKEADLSRAIKLSAGQPGRVIRLLSEPDYAAQQQDNLELLEKLLKADLVWRFEQAQKLSQNALVAQETLGQWQLWLRDRILERSGQEKLAISSRPASNFLAQYQLMSLLGACREIQRTQAILHNASFNARLALEVLMTKL